MADTINHNPDILTCLANLSNDEVFTPPELANKLLDLIPEDFWKDPNVKVLDPACKSGVFLREAAKRFIKGLETVIPDLQKRIDHIFHEQLYGYAITELTSHLSRRSVYCSKTADGPYSVSHFDRDWGNINYKRMEHKWVSGECAFCGASKEVFNRGKNTENYAYRFIHLDEKKIKDLKNMKFDLIISNPPYMMSDGGGNGASAKPIYQLFIDTAKKLNPRYITMITPSRWFTGGKGLDNFRDEMLTDNKLKEIHDFPEATDCFGGVQIKGGVSYFLWERDYNSNYCDVYNHKGDLVDGPVKRPLLEKGCEVFIRYNNAIEILHKIQSKSEDSMEDLVSARMPYGFPNTFKGYNKRTNDSDLLIYVSGNDREIRGTQAYVPLNEVIKGQELIDCHKVYIGKAGSGSDSFPHAILPKPFYGAPNTVCNESYLVIGPFDNEAICENVMSYIATKFFRFLVLLKKSTQNAPKGVYQFVPVQDFSKPWTDEELYAKYNLSEDEIAFIESMIKPMDLGDSNE